MSDDNSNTTVDSGSSAEAGSAGKDKSSFILNILMILFGLLFFARGVLNFMVWLKAMAAPEWLKFLTVSLAGKEVSSAFALLGTEEVVATVLGFWSLLAGILLFLKQESGWGMAMVIISTMTGMGIANIIQWLAVPQSFDVAYWPNWLTMVLVLLGALGFVYLLLTKKRYS